LQRQSEQQRCNQCTTGGAHLELERLLLKRHSFTGLRAPRVYFALLIATFMRLQDDKVKLFSVGLQQNQAGIDRLVTLP
jgi:hypothetical protein